MSNSGLVINLEGDGVLRTRQERQREYKVLTYLQFHTQQGF